MDGRIISLESSKTIYGEPCHNVLYNGLKIGQIHFDRDSWHKETPYFASLFRKNQERPDYLKRYRTLYEAKKAIIEEYEKNRWGEDKESTADVKALPYNDKAEFYPTPNYFVGQMLAGIDWKMVSSVLEPSAGKGNLCDGIKKAYAKHNRYGDNKIDIDCIEKDPNLQLILVGQGRKLIHDDFLTFHTYKKYDLIVMNPPFSNGDEHLLKALELQKNGGQIVCLLNAETIRNPYTNRRKLLMQQLKKHNANIRFVSHSFCSAERKTDVEVAIVRVNIPCQKTTSFIFENLKKAKEKDFDMESPNWLASADFIDSMIERFNFEVEGTLRLIKEYRAMEPYIMDSMDESKSYRNPIIELRLYGHNDFVINEYMRAVREKYWNALFRNEELMSKFTSNIRSEFTGMVNDLKDYDFTKFNIQKVLCQMNCQLIKGVKETILNLFETLSAKHSYYPECEKNIHYYNGWCTNKAHKVGYKAILPVNGFYAYSLHKGELDTHRCYSVLSDMENAFNYLDGCMTDEVSLSGALERASRMGKTKNIQCKYFDVTFYKKGTMHIHFTNERVVDALNIFAAKDKNWLPPHYGKTKYEDLDPDTKRTVDEFQGEEKYREVCDNPAAYIFEPTNAVPMLTTSL